jgi:hypothetical protein
MLRIPGYIHEIAMNNLQCRTPNANADLEIINAFEINRPSKSSSALSG